MTTPHDDDATLTTEDPVTESLAPPPEPLDPGRMPVAEAFAYALQQQGHQHAAAVPEDAPVQGRLPLPRPTFDFEGSWHQIREQRVICRAFALEYERLTKATKRVKADMDDADGTMKQLLDRLAQAEDEAAAAPDDAQADLFPHGPECPWERGHPGEMCGVCFAAREAVRAQQLADTLEADAAATAAAEQTFEELGAVLPSPGDDVVVGDPGVLEPEEIDGDTGDPLIEVGTLVVATRATGVCDEGELGVCYEVYDRGCSFIFAGGRYDGFTLAEIRLSLRVTGHCEALRDYQFTTVLQLKRDFRARKFAAALLESPIWPDGKGGDTRNWWVTFANGTAACYYGPPADVEGRAAAKGQIKTIRPLPYPATPQEPPVSTYESNGKTHNTPTLCYAPQSCQGRTACPKNYACSE